MRMACVVGGLMTVLVKVDWRASEVGIICGELCHIAA
jgi:hypothetical protein